MKNRKLPIIVTLIIIIILVALLYALLRPKTDNTSKTESASTSVNSSDSDTNTPPGADRSSPDAPVSSAEGREGKYVDYSQSGFAAESNARRVIFFHASWCPQCRALEKSIKEGTIPTGWVILKTNYDTSNELKQKYGVTLQTTLVEVDKTGALKKKFVAYDEPNLQAVITALGK